MRARLPKVGDVLRMESFSDEDVLVHYVRKAERRGPFVVVYRGPRSEGDVNSLEGHARLFGPVLCGVNPPVRSGVWTRVGRVEPPDDFRLPPFLASNGGRPPYDPPFWFLVDVERGTEERLGYGVPEELRGLEGLCVWPWELIEERIRVGNNECGYEQTMSHYP